MNISNKLLIIAASLVSFLLVVILASAIEILALEEASPFINGLLGIGAFVLAYSLLIGRVNKKETKDSGLPS